MLNLLLPKKNQLVRYQLPTFFKTLNNGGAISFPPTVRHGHRKQQGGIHPALVIATLLDPKYKNLTLMADDGSKEGIKKKVVEIIKDSEIKKKVVEIIKDSEKIHRSNNHLDQKTQPFIIIIVWK